MNVEVPCFIYETRWRFNPRRLLSIDVMFSVLIIVSLVVSVAIVCTISTVGAFWVITALEGELRTDIATSAGSDVQDQINIMTSGLHQLKSYWSAMSAANLSDYSTNNRTRKSVSEQIRTMVISFEAIPKITLLFPDAVIGWEDDNNTIVRVESLQTSDNTTTLLFTYYYDGMYNTIQ
jgi:hypothetical protein